MERDITLALMTGIDIPYPPLQLVIHSPTIKEIAYMGEQDFFTAVQYLCIDKENVTQDENVLLNLSNFQILMKVLEQPSERDNKGAIQTLLMLLFPKSQILLMPKSINIVNDDNIIMIDENNFGEFQNVVKRILCLSNLFQGKNIVYNPQGQRAKEIAAKIMRGRQRVAAQKAESSDSILTRYLSILRIGAQIPLSESMGYNLFQLFDQVERYNAYVEWDTDLRVRLAGGKPDKQVESWMRNLYSMK